MIRSHKSVWVTTLLLTLSFIITLLLPGQANANNTGNLQQQELEGYYFAAARNGNLDVMTAFLDAGIPVDLRNVQSYTPLMIAAYNGQPAMVNLLLSRGANACLQDKRGNTALMGAIFKVELTIAKRLINTDCDHELTNRQGEDALSFADLYQRQEISELLRSPTTR
ncbi:Phosphocholine transferase AnkX [BD1-7 clade bacterium]|uniref:Phosphocholine transferase AnkX n=1 Tax=BD1-7 clade bacterium TaxID=2029982 RepID=A0A5S9NSL1_9GAMM|nr:Phosphocholine transferase AnkX [BD1-7 clade bacterium]CAA0093610.1 Phosphocholine transferase AnkX [BD1-7 clade bacterium]